MSANVVVRKNKGATEAIKKGEEEEDGALHKYSTFSLPAGLIRTGTK